VTQCALTTDEIQQALCALRDLREPTNLIAESVASIPTDWPISEPERLAMARFLDVRREHLISQIL
jgi:hypothetical protein